MNTPDDKTLPRADSLNFLGPKLWTDEAIQTDMQELRAAISELSELKRQYEDIFNNTQDALFLMDVDPDGEIRFVRLNPTEERLLGYRTDEIAGLTAREAFGEELGAALDTGYHQCVNQAAPLSKEEVLAFPPGTIVCHTNLVPVIRDGRVQGIVGSAMDITDRKRAQEELRESRRALQTLMSNLPGMAYRCRIDLDWTMELVSEGCTELTGYSPVDLLGNQRISFLDLIHPDDRESVIQDKLAAIRDAKPFRRNYRIFTAEGEEKWVWEQSRGVTPPSSSIVAVEGFITDATDRVLAYQRLEERVRSRTREIQRRREVAEGLRDVLTVINSNRPLSDILDHIVTEAGRLLGAETGSVYRFEGGSRLTIHGSLGLPKSQVLEYDLTTEGKNPARAFFLRQPVPVSDLKIIPWRNLVSEDPLLSGLTLLTPNCRSLLVVPVVIKNEVYGGFALHYDTVRVFSAEDIELATTLSEHAALAVQNAWLRAQAEKSAVAAERSRIARDLHDSVTQTLFSASLIAHALPRVYEPQSAEGKQRLEQLQLLTRGALAEMRTLLLELRPASIVEARLGELLQHLTEAASARGKIRVDLEVNGHTPLLPDVQVAFYRIAQESLNNISRHSKATEVHVHLECKENRVRLLVSDNGSGFCPEDVTTDHLGLSIMRERAFEIGADLTIDTQIGGGTRITVEWESALDKECS